MHVNWIAPRETPETIKHLLRTMPLDPRIVKRGAINRHGAGLVEIWGNFSGWSAAFSIDFDEVADAAELAEFVALVDYNLASPEYAAAARECAAAESDWQARAQRR